MRYVSAVFRSNLLSAILFAALLPLSFRASASGTHFVFAGGRPWMVAFALWALCVTLAGVAVVRSRRQTIRIRG
jgi:hypothetical protein